MKVKFVLFGLSLGIVAASQIACSNQGVNNAFQGVKQENSQTAVSTEGIEQEDILSPSLEEDTGQNATSENGNKDDNEAIMAEFIELTSDENVKIADVIDFIQKNVDTVSKENASTMLLNLEELQIAYRTVLEEKYFSQEIQAGFIEMLLDGIDYTNPENIEDEGQKSLVQETRSHGFTIDQAEGTVFPIIDYTIYEDFRTYATEDIADYFHIMAIESAKPFAKDAALMIEWDKVIDRLLQAESFITKFDSSSKAEEIASLYRRYERIALLGLDNTPLFDYDGNTMKEEAKEAYEKAIATSEGSAFLEELKNYMDVIAENDYKLTKEVIEFRDNLIK